MKDYLTIISAILVSVYLLSGCSNISFPKREAEHIIQSPKASFEIWINSRDKNSYKITGRATHDFNEMQDWDESVQIFKNAISNNSDQICSSKLKNIDGASRHFSGSKWMGNSRLANQFLAVIHCE